LAGEWVSLGFTTHDSMVQRANGYHEIAVLNQNDLTKISMSSFQLYICALCYVMSCFYLLLAHG
jgi:hypothetical protein